MQRSLLALMILLTVLYGCGQASTPVERAQKPHGLDKQERAAAELAPEPPESKTANLPKYNNTSRQDEEQEMIEMACEDWESKGMGAPPAFFCQPAGLSPAFCHSSSRPAFCK
jgi:hypothetical protein